MFNCACVVIRSRSLYLYSTWSNCAFVTLRTCSLCILRLSLRSVYFSLFVRFRFSLFSTVIASRSFFCCQAGLMFRCFFLCTSPFHERVTYLVFVFFFWICYSFDVVGCFFFRSYTNNYHFHDQCNYFFYFVWYISSSSPVT